MSYVKLSQAEHVALRHSLSQIRYKDRWQFAVDLDMGELIVRVSYTDPTVFAKPTRHQLVIPADVARDPDGQLPDWLYHQILDIEHNEVRRSFRVAGRALYVEDSPPVTAHL